MCSFPLAFCFFFCVILLFFILNFSVTQRRPRTCPLTRKTPLMFLTNNWALCGALAGYVHSMCLVKKLFFRETMCYRRRNYGVTLKQTFHVVSYRVMSKSHFYLFCFLHVSVFRNVCMSYQKRIIYHIYVAFKYKKKRLLRNIIT